MYRWKVLVILFVLFKYISSQPLPEDTVDRPPRQLNFGECCPCEDKTDINNDGGDEFMDAAVAGSESFYSRPREMEDCPCRFRNGDSQGASSFVFPSTMNYAGNIKRFAGKNENLKPIFNPEVDLAASVLEAIKKVTEEEYEEALVRDAAKTTAKESNDFLIEDATPEESANIISAIVKPEFSARDDDIITDKPHVQQSRCIHSIENMRYNDDSDTQLVPKSNSLFKKPKLFKSRSRFLQKKPFNMDSSVGASNIHEHILPVNKDAEDLDVSPTREIVNNDKGNFNSDSNRGEYCFVNNIPDFQSDYVQNQIEVSTNRPLLEQALNQNTNLFKKGSKFNLGGWLRENKEKLYLPISTTPELIEKKLPHTKLDFQNLNIKENNSPLSLKNLLNLRDVELLPLKDLLHKQVKSHKNKKVKKPSFSKISSLQMTPMNEVIEDSKSEREKSIFNGKKNSKNLHLTGDCQEEMFEYTPFTNDISLETKDISSDLENKPFDSRVNMKGLGNNYIEYDSKEQSDSMTDSSIYVSKTIERLETFRENSNLSSEENPRESPDQNRKFRNQNEIKEYNIDTMDMTVSHMRDRLAGKLEQSQSFDANTKNRDVPEKVLFINDLENEEIPMSKIKNRVEECQTSRLAYVTTTAPVIEMETTTMIIPNLVVNDLEVTTFNSDVFSDSVGDSSNNDAITELNMEELQRQSDALLEEEYNRLKPKCVKEDDDLKTSQTIDRGASDLNMKSSDILEQRITVPDASDNFYEIVPNSFLGNADDSEITQLTPTSTRSKEIILNDISKENDILNPQSIEIPDQYVLKRALSDINDVLNLPPLKPLPTFDDIKTKLANLLPNYGKEATGAALNNIQEENVPDSETSSNFREKSAEEKECLTESITSESLQTKAPEEYDILSSRATLQSESSILKESMPNLREVLNTSPIGSLIVLDNIKETNINSGTAREQNEREPESFDNITNEENYNTMKSLPNPIDMSPEASDIIENAGIPRDVDAIIPVSLLQPQQITSRDYLSDTRNESSHKSNILDDSQIKVNELNWNNFDSKERKIVFEENITDLVTNAPFLGPIDANVEASDIIMNVVPNYGEKIGSQSGLQPLIHFLENPQENQREKAKSLKYMQLPTPNDIKMNLSKLLLHNITNVSNFMSQKILNSKKMSDSIDLLSLDMPTDASSSNFQYKAPPSRNTDNNDSKLYSLKQSSIIPDIRRLNQYSFKNNLPPKKEFKLEPAKVASNLRDKDLLRTTSANESKNQLRGGNRNLRYHNVPKISKFNPEYIRQHVLLSPDRTKDNGFTSSRNTKNLVSRLQGINDNRNLFRNTKYSSPSILDTINKHNEELNDKLKILESFHNDFNEKIDSARNNILDKSKLLVSGPFIKKLKTPARPALNRRLSAKPLIPIETAELKPIKRIALPKLESKKSRMPAANVPMPKSVYIPEFNSILKKSRPPTLGLQRQNEDSASLRKQKYNIPIINTFSQEEFGNKKEAISVVPTMPRHSMRNKHTYLNTAPKTASGEILKATPKLNIKPRVTNPFLSKSKDQAPVVFKQPRIQTDLQRNGKENTGTDMFREASETNNRMSESLKENISYKCHLVCTKD